MTEHLRWGILATGGIASAFTRDLRVVGAPVTAVGSRDLDRSRAFADEHGIARAHGSYEELVADPEVDVVYVATPHPAHAGNALLALDAGKHVLVEKPFTISEAEARAVMDRAAEKGLIALEAMWTRWLPHMIRMREIIAAGTLGELRAVTADHDQKANPDPAGRMLNPELGGGALLDLGIYPVSFAWDVLGAPDRVVALSDTTPTGVDGQTAIILSFPGGRKALLHTELDARGSNRAVVLGTEGRIEIDPVWYTPTSFTVYDSAGDVVERYASEVEGRGMQFQALELERLVAEGRDADDLLPPDETVAIMGTLDEVRRQIGLRYPGE
ncbi:Gfo/Idh/MocA family protein [Pseudolysinimonas sp.]|uniref:Gfo/Idh/MocA family protein n=1 Tax=Pseudolysinimonas sp. TaxID=2680009 RepID=UPI003F7E5735